MFAFLSAVLEGLLLAICLQQEAPPIPKPGEAPIQEENPIESIHGGLNLKYRYRWTADQSDSDLYEYLQLSWGDPAKYPISLSASARVAEDLDGNRKVAGYYPYNSLDDTYSKSSTARLYTAYVDFHRLLPGIEIRGGRQILEEQPEAVPMDGGSVRFSAEGFSVGGFGGIPVNLFESPSQGDSMFGGWIEASPWARARVKADYLHIRDETVYGLFENDLFGVSAEQSLGSFRAQARYTNLDSDSRDLTARLTGAFAEAGLILDGQATYLFTSQKAQAYALDPYALFLMDLEPYVQWTARASQAFGTQFGVDLAVTQRMFVRGSEDTTFNHEFVHASATPRLDDWPIPGLSLSASADYWRSTGDDYWTAGGDAALKLHSLVTVGVGTSYSLYTIDFLTGQEHERVRSVYASLRWKFPPRSTLDVRITLEKNEIDTFHSLEVGARHDF